MHDFLAATDTCILSAFRPRHYHKWVTYRQISSPPDASPYAPLLERKFRSPRPCCMPPWLQKNMFVTYVLSWQQPFLGFIDAFLWRPMLPCPLWCLSLLLFGPLLSCVTRVNSNKDSHLLFKNSLIFPFLRAFPAQFRNIKVLLYLYRRKFRRQTSDNMDR